MEASIRRLGDPGRTADRVQRLTTAIEHVDATTVAIRNIDIVMAIECDAVLVACIARDRIIRGPLREQVAIAVEFLHPTTVVLDDIDVALHINGDVVGLPQPQPIVDDSGRPGCTSVSC